MPLRLRIYAKANDLEESSMIFYDRLTSLKEEAINSLNELKIDIESNKLTMIEAKRKRMEL